MRASIVKWRVVVFVFVPSIVQIGCGKTSSPDTAAGEYVRSLTGSGLDGIWNYDTMYANELSGALQNVPKAMWQEKTDAIRAGWMKRIQNDRNLSIPVSNMCWQLFRPGAKTDIVETRAINQNGADASNWKSFVKVKFSAENEAPIFWFQSRARRLREGTVVMDIIKLDPPASDLRIASTCEIVPDGLAAWAVPALGKEQALQMFKDGVPDGERPRVTFNTAWAVSFSNGMGGRRPEDMAAAASLKSVFSKYGVRFDNVRDEHDTYSVNGMVVPAAWNAYSLPSAYKNYSTPLPTYALNESTDFSIENFQQTRDDEVLAKIRIAYNGCTPICNVVKEINPIKLANGDSAAMIMLLPPGRQDRGPEWASEQMKDVYFRWNVTGGWQFK
jgi:hypothetical protein